MFLYFFSQKATKVNPAVVNIDIINKGVRPGKIDPFKKAGAMRGIGNSAAMDLTIFINKDNFASLHIFDMGKIHYIEGDTL